MIQIALLIPGDAVGLNMAGGIGRPDPYGVTARPGLPGEIPPHPGASYVRLPQPRRLPGRAVIHAVFDLGDAPKGGPRAPPDELRPGPQLGLPGEFHRALQIL